MKEKNKKYGTFYYWAYFNEKRKKNIMNDNKNFGSSLKRDRL